MTSYPRWRQCLESLAIVAALACGLGLVHDLARHADGALSWLVIAALLGLGYLAADLVTGMVHWAGDRLGSPDTPLLGPGWIAPFREHHDDPGAMTERGFVELCGGSFLAVAPVWAGTWILLSDQPGVGAGAVRSFLLALGLFTGLTNQFHCWAHARPAGGVVAWLQDCGLILPPARHALHHTPPYSTHYCVTTAWLNRPLERIGFFRSLDRALHVSAQTVPASSPDTRQGAQLSFSSATDSSDGRCDGPRADHRRLRRREADLHHRAHTCPRGDTGVRRAARDPQGTSPPR